jgi:hypothetical protein
MPKTNGATTKKIDRLDTKIEQLSAIIAEAENQLADPAIYQSDNKARLTEQLQRQADAKSTLEEVEQEWMEQQEALEALEATFNQH